MAARVCETPGPISPGGTRARVGAGEAQHAVLSHEPPLVLDRWVGIHVCESCQDPCYGRGRTDGGGAIGPRGAEAPDLPRQCDSQVAYSRSVISVCRRDLHDNPRRVVVESVAAADAYDAPRV